MATPRKSAEAFRTISEVAEILGIQAHVLRFWESRFTQIKPVKRGGGRRYYRPQDIDLLYGIRDLLYSDGLTIKGVQKLLREQGVKHVAALGHTARAAVAPEAPVVPEPVQPTAAPAPDPEPVIAAPAVVTPAPVAPVIAAPRQTIHIPKPVPEEDDSQIDLFAHAARKLRPAFPPDPERAARKEKIRAIYNKLVDLRRRMAAQA